MKHKSKHTNKLYEYLEQTNALSGTDAQIKAAIREYRKLYKAEWRRRKRLATQEVTVTLDMRELQIVANAARKHHRSNTQFLKDAVLAYCNKTFIVPDILIVNSIRESLILTYSEVQRRFEDTTLAYNIGKEILQKIEQLEVKVLTCLCHPQNLNDRILSEIRNNPGYKDTLCQLLQTVK